MGVASRFGLVALLLVALAQIILSGAHRRPRLAVGIEVVLGHDGDAAVLAHLDEIETAGGAPEHSQPAFELWRKPLHLSFYPERLDSRGAIETCLPPKHATPTQ